jgi:lambda repressor-like predicted transcriptional regulator
LKEDSVGRLVKKGLLLRKTSAKAGLCQGRPLVRQASAKEGFC